MKKLVSQLDHENLSYKESGVTYEKQKAMLCTMLKEVDDLFSRNFIQKGNTCKSVVELWVLEPEERKDYLEYMLEKEEWKKWRKSRISHTFSVEAKCDKSDVEKLFGTISKVL